MKFKKRNLEVTIDGQTLADLMLDFEDMVLHQQIHSHHRFELSLVSGMEDDFSIKEEDFIGKIVKVKMGAQALSGKAVPFVAIITNVKAFKEHASKKNVYLSGYTPDYLMNLSKYTRAFVDQSLQNIVDTIAGEYDGQLIDITCSPKFTETIPYVVQYQETDYQFIKRLAQQYGEWFYYDGDNFVFGERVAGDTLEMILRKNLLQIEYDLDLVPPSSPIQMYNYHEAQPFKNDTGTFPTPSFAPAQKALGASDNLFSAQNKKKHHSVSTFYTESQGGLDAIGDAIAGKRANDLANIRGVSDMFGPTICSIVDWHDKNILTTVSKGKFVIINATHSINSVGEYRVEFTGVPDGNDYPPVDNSVRIPQIGTEIAKVTDNKDDEKNARIKVQFQWMESHQMTQFIRLASTAAGSDRGFYWVPEVDDEVIIAYENLNPDRPYVLACVYNSRTTVPSESNAQNDYKSIVTRSGHRIELCDTEGSESITIIDKNENTIEIDTPGDSISITANSSINLTAPAINMLASDSITMNAGKIIEGAAGLNLMMGAGVSASLIAGKDTTIMAGKLLSASGGKTAKFSSGGGANLQLEAKGDAKMKSKKKMDFSTKESTTTATKKMTIKSKKSTIQGSSKAIVKGSKVDIS